MSHRAVIFDLGGVVLGSPLHAIAAYERELGIRAGAINRVVAQTGAEGAWGRLERGLADLAAFAPAFEAECAAVGFAIDARVLMQRVGEISQPRPAMLAAIRALRARGLRVAALTNNWNEDGRDGGTRALRGHFDAFFESIESRRRIAEAAPEAPSDAARRERLVAPSPAMERRQAELSRFLSQHFYNDYRVRRMRRKASGFVREMFLALTDDTKLLPPPAQAWAKEHGAPRAVCDYLASMTDREAIQEYRRLFHADAGAGPE